MAPELRWLAPYTEGKCRFFHTLQLLIGYLLALKVSESSTAPVFLCKKLSGMSWQGHEAQITARIEQPDESPNDVAHDSATAYCYQVRLTRDEQWNNHISIARELKLAESISTCAHVILLAAQIFVKFHFETLTSCQKGFLSCRY